MPRGATPLLAQIGEQAIPFLAPDRRGPEQVVTIPAEQPVEGPSAEAAVLVVEHDVTFHLSRVEGVSTDAVGSAVTMARMYRDLFDRNPYGTNCWLLGADEAEDAVVVDPGFEPDDVRALLTRAGRRPAAVLLTHAHVDHAFAAGEFAGDDVPVYVHQDDAVAFDDLEAWNPGFENPLTEVKDLRRLVGGEELPFEGFSVRVRHTPGHTPGHCSFLTDATLLAGDLVFAGSIGRSDFPNSSPAAMETSLRWFLTLDDTLDVLPGHGPTTTVGRERSTNPILAGLA